MKKLVIDMEEQLLKNSEEVLDNMGLDILSAVRVMLKRVVRDGNATFLFDKRDLNNSAPKEAKNSVERAEVEPEEVIKMTKNKAIGLFKNNGIIVGKNATFASKNKAAYNYWANPSFDVLDDDWYLILNDWARRELYLFEIPEKTFCYNQLVSRADKNKIDLQIMYEDNSFTDTRSKISFAKYLKEKMEY